MYPRVAVIEAPGYENFEGDLIMEVPRADGLPMSIIGVIFEEKKEILAIPSRYVVRIVDVRETP